MSIPEGRETPECERKLELCRVCNLQSHNTISLYKPQLVAGEMTTLAELLSYCANLQVIEEEQFLPGQMCNSCVEVLSAVYEFKRKALSTDLVLRKRHERSLKFSNSPSVSPSPFLSRTYSPTPSPVHRHGASSPTPAEQIPSIDANSDEYIFVLEEAESLEANPVEEILQADLQLSCEEPNVEILEVDYDLGEAYEQELVQEVDGQLAAVHVEPDREQMPAMEVKMRAPQRRRSFNPALQCLICGKQLSTNNSYKYHMQLHGDNRPYVCSICGDSFKTRNSYDGHVTMHNPNNPNKCRICGKAYRQPSSLRSHLYSHSGFKPFTCDICGKGLTQKSGYKKHMLTHTGEKPHNCDTCGRSFRYSSNLIAHKRSHNRKAPLNLRIGPGKRSRN